MAETVLVKFPVKPEARDEFAKIMDGALPDTRKHDGCLAVMMFVPEDDPGTILLYEEWETRDHQAKYFAWRVESGMMEQIGGFLAGEPSVSWVKSTKY